jgi:hypothetical protein
MLSYDGVKQHPEQFLACTSLTVEEFDVLLPSFSQAWDDYVKKNYVNSGGGQPKLPHVTDKLFFILFYYKVYPIQAATGAIFGISQGQVSFWVGVLSIVLRQTLGVAQCLNAQLVQGVGRIGDQLAQEDLLVAVQGVDHQLEQFPDFGLETQRLFLFGSGGFPCSTLVFRPAQCRISFFYYRRG